MKTSPRVARSLIVLVASGVMLLFSGRTSAQNYWTGGAGTTNWSSGGNWTATIPPGASDSVIFDSLYGGVVGTQGLVNNIVDGAFTVSTLGYDTITTNGFYTTQINPGVTLSVVPQTAGANAMAVGSWIPNGTPATNGQNDQVYATILGTNATLSVNGLNSTIRIEQAGSGGSHFATLDLSRLSTFTASVSNILLGANLGSIAYMRPNGTLILAQTNVITTGPMGTALPGILLGCGGWTNTDGGIGNLTLGYSNILNVDWLAVGGHRANLATSTLGFGNITNGSIKLRGNAGGATRAPLVTIGDIQASDSYNTELPYGLNGTSRNSQGLAEFRGSTVDILVDSLILGRNLTTNETTAFNTGATGVGTGTMNFDAGSIDVNNLYLGYKIGTNYGGASGTLLANGGTLTVNNSVLMTFRTRPNGGFNGGNSTATMTIASNAVANVKGDILKGTPGQGTSTLNINDGGQLNMQPGGDSVPGNVTVDTLTISAGTLVNVSNLTANTALSLTSSTVSNFNNLTVGTLNLNANSALLNFSNLTASGTLNFNGGNVTNVPIVTAATIIGSGTIATASNVTNSTSLLPGSTASAGTLTLGGNLTLRTNATLAFALNTATTIGGGVNSYVNVGGNLALLATNVLSIAPLGAISAGPYRLVDYSGSLSGTPIFTNSTRYALGLDLSTAGQINLTNGGGSPLSLVWKGANATGGTNWNLLVATNWNNLAEPFFNFDSVAFDNNGVTTNINATGLLYPQSVTVNDTRNYSIIGSGKISGNAGITKNGTGQLTVNNTGGNDFNGAIVVNAGIFKIGRADSFGSTNGATTIASGAMLDLGGTGANSPGETVIISGTGITNGGAIINTGADQNNGLRYVSLAAGASIGNYPGRWDIRGSGGNSSFSGGLFLNGFTLTKMGAGKTELADVICTNSGSMIVSNGILAFTRSIVDGPGTVTIVGTNMLQLENNSTGTVAKPLIFRDTSVLQLVGNAFTLSSPITNLNTGGAGLTIDTALNLTMTNVLSGSGAVTKISAGSLILQAPDLCTGPTTVSGGALVLTNAGSIANTPSINLATTNTTLDVSGISGFTLGSAQTLSGSGTVAGSVTTSTGTTLVPGNSLGTLTITTNLTLNNTTNLFELGSDASQIGNGQNDLISVGGNLSLSGVNTLKITPVGPLDTSLPYTLITYSNTLSGGLANLAAVSVNPRFSFSLVNPNTTPGAIQVTAIGSPVSLTWKGGQAGNPTLWNSGITSNWLNGASADVFYAGDTVVFDDTATTNTVTITNTVLPGSMTANHSSLNYTLNGAGTLVAGSLTKDGSGSFTLANVGTNQFSLGITLNGGTLAINQPTDRTLAATITDNGGGGGTLEKQGTNVLTLSGNNAGFNGTLRVSSGILRPSNTNAVGTSTGGTVATGNGTLDVNGLNLGVEPITASGAGFTNQGAIVNSGAAQNNALINVTLAGNTTFGGIRRWDIRTQGANNASLLTGGQPYNLTKVGTNQIVLVNVGLDDALGDIDVREGIFGIEGITQAPSTGLGDATKTLTVRSNALLHLFNANNAINKVIVLQDGGIITNASGDNVISGGITMNGSNAFMIGTASLSLNGVNAAGGTALTGSGSLYMFGGGTLQLVTDNTFGGGATINGGVVMLNSSLSLTASKNVLVTTTTGGGGSTGTRITINNGAIIPPGVSVNLPSGQPGDLRSTLFSTNGEWQGPITFYAQAGAVTPGSVNITANSSNGTFTVSGPMSGILTNLILRGANAGVGKVYGGINVTNPSGLPPRLEKTEESIWTLYTNNNVWGDTIVHNGILQLGTNNPCPVTTFLTLGENVALCALDLNGFNQQFAGLTATAALINDYIVNSSTTSDSTLTIAGTNITTFGGIISDTQTFNTNGFAPAGTQRVGLTLGAANTGSLTLSGANAYTGPTLLNGGTLRVTGALSNTVVTVNNGATFGGTGVALGPVSVNSGGTLAVGPTVGILSISNNLTFAAGATNVTKFNAATTNDMVIGIGTLTYAGTLVVTNAGATPLADGAVLKLFNAASYTGSFASIIPAQPAPGFTWDTSSLNVNGTLKVIGPPKFLSVGVLPDNNFSLTASAQVGKSFSLLATTNVAAAISNWTTLGSGTVTFSPFTINDLTATNYPRRFYLLTVY